MKHCTTGKGNGYWVEGVFAFIDIGGKRLTFWESLEDLEEWVDSQYTNQSIN